MLRPILCILSRTLPQILVIYIWLPELTDWRTGKEVPYFASSKQSARVGGPFWSIYLHKTERDPFKHTRLLDGLRRLTESCIRSHPTEPTRAGDKSLDTIERTLRLSDAMGLSALDWIRLHSMCRGQENSAYIVENSDVCIWCNEKGNNDSIPWPSGCSATDCKLTAWGWEIRDLETGKLACRGKQKTLSKIIL